MAEEIKPPGWEDYDQNEMFNRAEELREWQDSLGFTPLIRAMMERAMSQKRWEYYTALVLHLETPLQTAKREANEEAILLDSFDPTPKPTSH